MPLPTLLFTNSLSRQKEPFAPEQPPLVRLYVCGPTVYDDAHLGHARCYITWDVLIRTLRAWGYTVQDARNITDVDDKILAKAAATGQSPTEVAKHFSQRFHEDMAALNVLPPTLEPKATEHMEAIIEGCQALIGKNAAYVTSEGTVYYRTASKADYGKLSQKPLDELRASGRVEADPEKESPLDFALWKHVAQDDPHFWESPFKTEKNPQGKGRPGWHMECSAMNQRLFEGKLDIHAGGADLMFPHHENEIAQSEAWTGHEPFARFWLHNGFVTTDGEKMSKSLGNVSTIRGLLQHFDANTLRYFLLTHHYRMPVDFTPEALKAAQNRVTKIHRALRSACEALGLVSEVALHADGLPLDSDDPVIQAFVAAMTDDLNTPRALAALDEGITRLNTQLQSDAKALPVLRLLWQAVWTLWLILGFSPQLIFSTAGLPSSLLQPLQAMAQTYQLTGPASAEGLIEVLLAHRQHAKHHKDWATADAIRHNLQALGLLLQDTSQGSSWEYHPPLNTPALP
ncbi:MAG: cysteine--tRNA ligase [Vampirovibrionales bacterium]